MLPTSPTRTLRIGSLRIQLLRNSMGADDRREPGAAGAGAGMGLYGNSIGFSGGDSSAVERNVAKLFREKVCGDSTALGRCVGRAVSRKERE